jgi:myo-inositol 2-dehydrogenase / D-chiro-inositol 1-dehydrogenase
MAQVNGSAARPRPRLLQIGVVGIGRMGQRHALNLLRLVPRVQLVCACSPAESDLQWAEEHLALAGVKIFRTFEEMIDFPGLEAVVIASATALHHLHTLESLKRGIHVLCEKPIAASMQEVSQLAYISIYFED